MHGLIADRHMTGVLAQQRVCECQRKRAKDLSARTSNGKDLSACTSNGKDLSARTSNGKDLSARTSNVMVCDLQMLDAVRRSEQNAQALSSAQANQSTGPTAGPAAAPAGVPSSAPSGNSSVNGSHSTQIKVSGLFSMLMSCKIVNGSHST